MTYCVALYRKYSTFMAERPTVWGGLTASPISRSGDALRINSGTLSQNESQQAMGPRWTFPASARGTTVTENIELSNSGNPAFDD